MAKEFAKSFYSSKQWQHCRNAYAASKGWLCERCLAKGLIVPLEIVHHKVYINENNINDPSITLNFDNLEGLCRECHEAEHSDREPRRFQVDEFGRVRAKF